MTLKKAIKKPEGEPHVQSRRRPVAKRPQRQYEEEFAEALVQLGCVVFSAADYKKLSGDDLADCLCVVRQFAPRPADPRTGRKKQWLLDFSVPRLLIYVEIDGFAGGGPRHLGGHRTWSGFHRDRKKDRALAFAGWRGLRYGPADMADVNACAREFIAFTEKIRGSEIEKTLVAGRAGEVGANGREAAGPRRPPRKNRKQVEPHAEGRPVSPEPHGGSQGEPGLFHGDTVS